MINGVLPEAEAEHDALAAAIWQREQEALANLPAGLSELPTDTLLLQPVNMVGVSALKGLLATRSEALPLPVTNILYTPENLSLSGLVDDIARSEHGLIMLMGKGGVGKTTMAAAIAVRLADMGFDVHLTTSDPAAHLSTTLNGSLKTCRSAASTLTMKPNAIASMFLRRREEIWTKQGNGYWKRIYALPVLKKLPCFRPSPV